MLLEISQEGEQTRRSSRDYPDGAASCVAGVGGMNEDRASKEAAEQAVILSRR